MTRSLETEGKVPSQWHSVIDQFSKLGFSNKEIHAILVDRGLPEEEAVFQLKVYKERTAVTPEQVEAARAHSGCVISLFILGIAFVVFLIKLGELF